MCVCTKFEFIKQVLFAHFNRYLDGILFLLYLRLKEKICLTFSFAFKREANSYITINFTENIEYLYNTHKALNGKKINTLIQTFSLQEVFF